MIAIVVGALWAGIAGILRVTRGVSEVISTIMLNAIAGILVGYLIDQLRHPRRQLRPYQGHPGRVAAGWLAPFTSADGQIWTLGLLAVLVGVGFWVLLNRTHVRLRPAGHRPSRTAAVASGIKVNRMILASMLISGGVAGLIGMPAFFGDAHNYGTTFQAGLGFTGIAVALLGRNHPLGMVFGALLFAFLTAQSNSLQMLTGISPTSSRSPRASSCWPS